jgi:hypothetical protein
MGIDFGYYYLGPGSSDLDETHVLTPHFIALTNCIANRQYQEAEKSVSDIVDVCSTLTGKDLSYAVGRVTYVVRVLCGRMHGAGDNDGYIPRTIDEATGLTKVVLALSATVSREFSWYKATLNISLQEVIKSAIWHPQGKRPLSLNEAARQLYVQFCHQLADTMSM